MYVCGMYGMYVETVYVNKVKLCKVVCIRWLLPPLTAHYSMRCGFVYIVNSYSLCKYFVLSWSVNVSFTALPT